MNTPNKYGPLPKSDNQFTARMRFHQSWYRETVLKAPYGIGPFPSSDTKYGNMLTQESAEAGLNFLTPEIFAAVKKRLAEAEGLIEEFRLMRNMLSSQPLCFNMFGYLGLNLDLATEWMQGLFPGEVKKVERVVVEYSPEPMSEYLADRTAFDSFVEYTTVDDKPAFLGIETKLTEPFSQKEYDTPEYRRWMDHPSSPWTEEAGATVADKKHNQLWRDHLLAVSMMQHPKSEYARGRLMLVRHQDDKKCEDVTRGYQSLLRKGDNTFVDMPIDWLLATIATLDSSKKHINWIEAFLNRYVGLDDSQAAYDAWRG